MRIARTGRTFSQSTSCKQGRRAQSPWCPLRRRCNDWQEPDLKSGEMDCLHRSFAAMTAGQSSAHSELLASSTRKTAQKVIEEAGEVAIGAVKHRPRGIVRESADLLYHLVALWHRGRHRSRRRGNEMRRVPTPSASPKSCRRIAVPHIADQPVTSSDQRKGNGPGDRRHPSPRPRRRPAILQRAGSGTPGTLDPAIHDTLQSAMGIVRETTGLLCNITELGLALLWDPKASPAKTQPETAAPSLSDGATIIPFALSSKRQASSRTARTREFHNRTGPDQHDRHQ